MSAGINTASSTKGASTQSITDGLERAFVRLTNLKNRMYSVFGHAGSLGADRNDSPQVAPVRPWFDETELKINDLQMKISELEALLELRGV